MYCPRCKEEFSPFQSICPTCFGDLRASAGGERKGGFLNALDGALELPARTDIPSPDLSIPSVSGLAIPSVSGLAIPSVSGLAIPSVSGLAIPSFSGLAIPSFGPAPDLSVPSLGEVAGTVLAEPIAEVRSGVRRAARRLQEGEQAVSAALQSAAEEVRQGEGVTVALQHARAELLEALDGTGRDLQRMANATREGVLRELKKETANSRERAARLLHERQLQIGQEMSRRLEDLANRFVRLKGDLDLADQGSIQSRLDSLQRQASHVLVGLQKEVDFGGGRLPDQVKEIVRQAGGDVEAVQARVQSVAQRAGESAEGLQKGCMGAGAAFVNLFIWPGGGHFILGRWWIGVLFWALWVTLPKMPDNSSLGTLIDIAIRATAAWSAWNTAQNR